MSQRLSGKATRTIGMIWRNSRPLASQFLHISEVVRQSARELLKNRSSRPFLVYTEAFDGPSQFTRQGAKRSAIWLIGQVLQRCR
ncbi:MAG: hypothetical protein GY761_21175 [Hyphomicrobiales bacterium]|nr:hypothetical protein [Hyphomicrobiales bacterium]